MRCKRFHLVHYLLEERGGESLKSHGIIPVQESNSKLSLSWRRNDCFAPKQPPPQSLLAIPSFQGRKTLEQRNYMNISCPFVFQKYFRDYWNIFDFIVVLGGLMDVLVTVYDKFAKETQQVT